MDSCAYYVSLGVAQDGRRLMFPCFSEDEGFGYQEVHFRVFEFLRILGALVKGKCYEMTRNH